jgi:hypothetical protein
LAFVFDAWEKVEKEKRRQMEKRQTTFIAEEKLFELGLG